MKDVDRTMAEKQAQASETNRLAKMSLWCAGIGWGLGMMALLLTVLLYLIAPRLNGSDTSAILWLLIYSGAVVGIASFFVSIVGIISSATALIGIVYSGNRARGLKKSIAGFVLSLTYLLIIAILGIWHWHCRYRPAPPTCAGNLRYVGTMISIYSAANDGKYPSPNKWCELLVAGSYINAKVLSCPTAPHGRIHYAMNPNCEPNSPGDVVLLFESKPGWNQVGGPELLNTENHFGKGCNILFNDMQVEFVTSEKLGNLKWGVQESNSPSP